MNFFWQRLLVGTGWENRQPFAGLKLRPKLLEWPAFWKQIVDRNAKNFR
jgi:hypothetical protein